MGSAAQDTVTIHTPTTRTHYRTDDDGLATAVSVDDTVGLLYLITSGTGYTRGYGGWSRRRRKGDGYHGWGVFGRWCRQCSNEGRRRKTRKEERIRRKRKRNRCPR